MGRIDWIAKNGERMGDREEERKREKGRERECYFVRRLPCKASKLFLPNARLA